jgi:hypothetical protein
MTIVAPTISPQQRFWSVTTILKEGLPKDALTAWAARVTAEAALERRNVWEQMEPDEAVKWLAQQRFRKTKEAQIRGSALHRIAEAWNLGQVVEVPEATKPYAEQYARFLEDHAPEFLMAEAPVYNLTWSYAGTLDGVVRLDGLRCVLDIKTTDKLPDHDGARPPWPDVALQLVAYRRAEWVGVMPERFSDKSRRYYVWVEGDRHEPMPETEGALALMISPADYRLVPVVTDETVWRSFLAVREVARWTSTTSKQVLRPDITEPTRKAA